MWRGRERDTVEIIIPSQKNGWIGKSFEPVVAISISMDLIQHQLSVAVTDQI